MTDWTTVSSLTTGAGTLVLAVATFAAVRSANRAARVAGGSSVGRPAAAAGALAPGRRRPEGVLRRRQGRATGRRRAVPRKSTAATSTWASRCATPAGASRYCMAGGSRPARRPSRAGRRRKPSGRTTRDIFIAPNDVGFWQAAFRDSADRQYDEAVGAVLTGRPSPSTCSTAITRAASARSAGSCSGGQRRRARG